MLRVFLLLSLLYNISFAQSYKLLLDKPGRVKRIRYSLATEIHLKAASFGKTKGTLTYIGPEMIAVNGVHIYVKDIEAIYFHPDGLIYKLSKQASDKLKKLAPRYFLSGLVNGLVFGLNPLITPGMVIIPAGCYILSPILKRLSYRVHRINNRKRLHTLNLPY